MEGILADLNTCLGFSLRPNRISMGFNFALSLSDKDDNTFENSLGVIPLNLSIDNFSNTLKEGSLVYVQLNEISVS